MMRQLDRKPRKGDRIGFGEFKASGYPAVVAPVKPACTVTELSGNLCWCLWDGQAKAQPFIWWFDSDQSFNKLAHYETVSPSGDSG